MNTSPQDTRKLLPSATDLQRVTYLVYISTAGGKGAGTDKEVFIRLIGDLSSSDLISLSTSNQAVKSKLHPYEKRESPGSHNDTPDPFFPIASTREFSFRTRDVGNLLRVFVQHDTDTTADFSAAWKPNRIVIENDFLHRSWSFLCPRWLSCDQGNTIDLQPSGEIAVGRRASNRASRRVSSGKVSRFSSFLPGSKKLFDSMRERFANGSPPSNASSSSHQAGTKRVLFQVQRFSPTSSHLYLTGSIPALGAWKPEHACRMTQYCPFDGRWRGDWRLELEIDDDRDEILYQYMVIRESESPSSRVATITNPVRILKLNSSEKHERNSEGRVIYLKDTLHADTPGAQPEPSPYNTPVYSSLDVISTPRGTARVHKEIEQATTPMPNVQALYGVQRDLTGTLESADPISSETSTSRKYSSYPLPSTATEESSAPLDCIDTNGDRGDIDHDTNDLPNHSTHTSWGVGPEMDSETTESSWGPPESLRRQSVDISSNTVSSQERRQSDMAESPFDHDNTQSKPNGTSPVSSRDLIHGGVVVESMESRSVHKEVSRMQNEREELQAERDTLRKQLEAMTLELDTAQSTDPSSPEHATGEEDLNAMREEMENLVAERDQVRVERDEYRGSVESIRIERDEFRGSVESIRIERDEFRGSVESIRLERDEFRGSVESIRLERDEFRGSVESIRLERNLSRDERDSMRGERDSMQGERDSLRTERDATTQNLEILQREKEEVLTKREELQLTKDDLQKDLDSLSKNESTVIKERDELAVELQQLQEIASKKTESLSHHEEMVEELDALRNETAIQRDEYEGKTTELRNELVLKQEEFESSLQVIEGERTTLHDRWAKEFRARRKLFNTIQELRGNIRVFCRVRPFKNGGSSHRGMAVSFPDSQLGDQGRIQLGGKSFEFDQVFQPSSTQEEVYDETSGVVASVVDGYNVCVFAYGQTGSGKTYTMDGSECNRGVNFRALENLFEIANERKDHSDVSISVSMLEIYNENLRDLIPSENGTENACKLEIRQDPSASSPNAVHVPNLMEVHVESFEHTWDVMMQGSQNRSQGRTDMNEHSSRSHLILRVTVHCEDYQTGVKSRGVLHLVDLAGSERVSRSNASGERLKEAQHINKSLSSLGDVFAALTSNSGHIPYRNSRLTYLLQDSLGGDSKTLMFVNVSCDDSDSSETTSSLLFAQRVAKVELRNAKKHTEKTGEAKATAALHEKESQNSELQGKLGGLQREVKKREEVVSEMKQRVRSLESELNSTKRSMEEVSKKESSGREGTSRELKEFKTQFEQDQAERKQESHRFTQIVKSKDAEIQELQAKLRRTLEEAPKKKVEREKSPKPKIERLTSAPTLGRNVTDRPSMSRIPRTASVTGRPPRQVRIEEREASPNPSIEMKVSDDSGSSKSTSSSSGGNAAMVGNVPARRMKESMLARPQASGLPRAATMRTGSRVQGPATTRKPLYAFGSRVENGTTEKGATTTRTRVPRSQTAILRPPQRANTISGAGTSGVGTSRTGIPGGRVTSSLRRAGTVSSLNRNGSSTSDGAK